MTIVIISDRNTNIYFHVTSVSKEDNAL